MTEEEAKTKWCPFARGCGGESGVNRSYIINPERNAEEYPCIGSACMAWRLTGTHDGRRGEAGAPQGYCGLAGRP